MRIRHIKLALMVAAPTAALAVITPPPALALSWYINGSLFSGTESITVSNLSELTINGHLKIGSEEIAVKILCTGASGEGSITESTRDTLRTGLKLSGCQATAISVPGGCKAVWEFSPTSELSSRISEVSGIVSDIFETRFGWERPVFLIEGCALEGEYGTLTGKAACQIQEPTVEAKSKECFFTEASSPELRFAGKPVEFSMKTLVSLAGGNKGKQFGVAAGKAEEVEEPALEIESGSSGKFVEKVAHAEQTFVISRVMPDPQFQVTEDTCSSKTLSVGSECEVKVSFTSGGEHLTGSMELASEEVGGSKKKWLYIVPLKGT